jgi:DNA-binding NarL/FixJ family response regulator
LRVILVDSSEVFRTGLKVLFAENRDVVVAGEASDAAAALAALRSGGAELVIADTDLPDGNGGVVTSAELLGAIRQIAPATRVLFLAANLDEVGMRQATSAGASGFAHKSQTGREILAAVREVGAGRSVAPPVRRTTPRLGEEAPKAAILDRLSAREREIFDLIIWGKTNKQVALKLGISVKTVETHRSHINGKLQVHSAAELVRLASLCGVLSAGGSDDVADAPASIHGAHESAAGAGHVDHRSLPRLVAKSG